MRSIVSAGSSRDRSGLVRRQGDPDHPGGGAALLGLPAGRSNDRAAEHPGHAADAALRDRALLRAARAGPVPDRRRRERRVHRPEHVRRLHHQRLQRDLHRPRAGDGPPDARVPALLSRDVSDADVRDEPGAAREQCRPDVGRRGTGNAHHGADGGDLSHARRRSRPPGSISFWAASASRWRSSARSSSISRPARSSARVWKRWRGACWCKRASAFDPALLNLAFVFLLLGYGTKVGLVPLHAWLPDAHAEGPTPISAVLSGLLLNVALFAVLRFKMVMSANERRARARPPDGHAGAGLRRVRVVHAVPPPRHQADVRLLLDRAHGDHQLRLRHGRAARELRRPAAHDHALA